VYAALLWPITEREEGKQSAVKMAGKEEWPTKNVKGVCINGSTTRTSPSDLIIPSAAQISSQSLL
jgi:hypothetical protein